MFQESAVAAFTTSSTENHNPESKHSSKTYIDSPADLLEMKPIYTNDYFLFCMTACSKNTEMYKWFSEQVSNNPYPPQSRDFLLWIICAENRIFFCDFLAHNIRMEFFASSDS